MSSKTTLSVLILTAVIAATAAGKTIYVDADASGAGNGSTWRDACVYLQDALKAAQPGDSILVAEGRYTPDRGAGNSPEDRRMATFRLKIGVAIQGGYAGLGRPDPNARDAELYKTVLSGDLMNDDIAGGDVSNLAQEPSRADNSYHVVTATGTSTTTVLDGLVITGGNANGPEEELGHGGGLYSLSGSLVLTHCTFQANSAAHYGGGMFARKSTPALDTCVFTGNRAEWGGAMYNWTASPTITDCRFIGNSAAAGAGMRNYDHSNPTIRRCTFQNNDANDLGGGMYNAKSSPTVTDCNFIGNSAIYGAAMRNYDESGPTLTSCVFRNNVATYGGAMENAGGSNAKVYRCTFRDNHANKYGGGMCNAESNPTIDHCTFQDNDANDYGGGMYNAESSPTVLDCNFIGNSATYGAGMRNFNGSNPTVSRCTFQSNVAAKYGGGMYNRRNSSPDVTDCHFLGNSAVWGGGMQNYDAGNPTVSRCTFRDNDANDYGGGMCNDYGSSPTVADCNFIGNSAMYGGGIENFEAGASVVHRCTFRDNDAGKYGGGIYTVDSNSTVIDCTFIGNSASYGGGVYNRDSNSVVSNCVFMRNAADLGGAMRTFGSGAARDVKIIGCLFRGNQALSAGGGLSNRECDPTLANCTFVYNSAKTGGALHASGSPSRAALHNCILWSNAAPFGSQFGVVESAALSFSHCDVQGALESAYNRDDSELFWGAGNLDKDPGLTPDGHLTAGSPCIDAGDPGAVLSDNGAKDIDGEPRVFGGRIDIGCDEFLDTDPGPDGLPDSWEQTYFGDTTSALPGDDPDGDGLTNIEEYALYSSNPIGTPYYVDAARAGYFTPDGTQDHPFATIQEGLDAARQGDTVLVAPGTYVGPGNCSLDFRGKAVALRALEGPAATVITANEKRCGFNFRSGETPASAVIGFTIRRSRAYYDGGAIRCWRSSPQIRNCILEFNHANGHGGAIYCERSMPCIADCTITGNTREGIYIRSGGAQLEGTVRLISDSLEVEKAFLWGDGTLEMDSGSLVHAQVDMRIRCNLRGNGTLQIDQAATCLIDGDAIIDLGCAGQEKGRIECKGLLHMKDDTILMNANVSVACARLEGNVIVSNSVITAKAGAPHGQFFIQDTVSVMYNDIHADGDRYMDLDPAVFKGFVQNNRIYVTITEGQNNTLGGLLELRGRDFHRSQFGENDFLCQLDDIPDFTTKTWTIEQLELVPGAKVNLTNRFDFDNGGFSEVMYVKKLILGNGSVLNTAFNRLYFGELEQATNTTVVNIPILGLSLNNIALDDENEFLSRVIHNGSANPQNPGPNRDNAGPPEDTDPNQGNAGPAQNADPDESGAEPPEDADPNRIDSEDFVDSNYSGASVQRITGLQPDPNGMMEMRNLEDSDPNSPTYGQPIYARAKGLFGKSSEEEILVRFEYLFCSDQGQLVIYLSDVPELLGYDDPARAEHYVEAGRVTAPPAGWPGSFGSGRFGVFEKIVPVRHLDFVRGTRIELELVGPTGACVLINNWDPGIRCIGTKCGDVAGPGHGDVDFIDVLAILSECGRRVADGHPVVVGETNTVPYCIDCYFSEDGVVTIEDALAVEWAVENEDADFPCRGANSVAAGGNPSKNLGLNGMSPSAQPAGPLLIAGKGPSNPEGHPLEDCLYRFTADGDQVGAPSVVPAGKVLSKVLWHDGTLYHLDMEQGLMREGQEIIPPGDYPYQSGMVYVGRYATWDPSDKSTDYVWSRPVQDVAFDREGNVYLVPVVVNPDGGWDSNSYYRAAVKLEPRPGGNPPYSVVQVYDISTENGHGLHEIEVDADGWVYVLKSCPSNTMDSLFVFDGATGQDKAGAPIPLDTLVQAPTCLHVSNATKRLYLASALNRPDANQTCIYVMDKTTLDPVVAPIEIPGMGHVTGITEDPATGTIWAVGFTIPLLPTQKQVESEDVGTWETSFYRPCIASIDGVGPEAVVRVFEPAIDWMLPVSVAWTGADAH